jgi:hypothetical protein
MSPPQISGMSPPIVEPMKILIQMYDPMLQCTTERFHWPHPDQEAADTGSVHFCEGGLLLSWGEGGRQIALAECVVSRSVGRGAIGGNLPRHKKTDISIFTELGEIKCG